MEGAARDPEADGVDRRGGDPDPDLAGPGAPDRIKAKSVVRAIPDTGRMTLSLRPPIRVSAEERDNRVHRGSRWIVGQRGVVGAVGAAAWRGDRPGDR
jgi:hypothetical protein